MRKIFFTMLMLLVGASTLMAQTTEEERRAFIKEREKTVKMAKKAVDAKISKMVKNEVKDLKKRGYHVSPGSLPMELQLQKQYAMSFEIESYGGPRYIMGEGTAEASSYNVAKKMAMDQARQNLAEKMGSEVYNVIESGIASNQVTASDGESMIKFTSDATTEINHKLGVTPVVTEISRDVQGGKEVRIVLSYEMSQMKSHLLNSMPDGEMKNKMSSLLKN